MEKQKKRNYKKKYVSTVIIRKVKQRNGLKSGIFIKAGIDFSLPEVKGWTKRAILGTGFTNGKIVGGQVSGTRGLITGRGKSRREGITRCLSKTGVIVLEQ